MKVTIRMHLFASMCNRSPITHTYNGKKFTGIVNEIQAEDGSGMKFNVKLHNEQQFFINFSTPKAT